MFSIASKASRTREQLDLSTLLRSGASLAAICAFAAAGPAWAQSDPATSPGSPGQMAGQQAQADAAAAAAADDAIVVTGIRQSLQNAQNIKRNADTVVDAITAEDIGALPDRSVTEALQRVPGVSINRVAGSNDPDHFSG